MGAVDTHRGADVSNKTAGGCRGAPASQYRLKYLFSPGDRFVLAKQEAVSGRFG